MLCFSFSILLYFGKLTEFSCGYSILHLAVHYTREMHTVAANITRIILCIFMTFEHNFCWKYFLVKHAACRVEVSHEQTLQGQDKMCR